MSKGDLNPYAPSRLAAARQTIEPIRGSAEAVTSWTLTGWTIGVCTAAGALFGISLGVCMIGGSLLFGGSFNAQGIVMIFMLPLFGSLVGGILALISSILTVGVTMAGVILTGKPKHYWNRQRIGWFAAFCGLVSGFLPLGVVSRFDPDALGISMIPAIFGAIAARLLIIPLARRAGRSSEPLPSEPIGNYPVPPHEAGTASHVSPKSDR